MWLRDFCSWHHSLRSEDQFSKQLQRVAKGLYARVGDIFVGYVIDWEWLRARAPRGNYLWQWNHMKELFCLWRKYRKCRLLVVTHLAPSLTETVFLSHCRKTKSLHLPSPNQYQKVHQHALSNMADGKETKKTFGFLALIRHLDISMNHIFLWVKCGFCSIPLNKSTRSCHVRRF